MKSESDRWLPPLVNRPACVPAPDGREPRSELARFAGGAAGLAVGLAAYFFRWDTAPSAFLEGTYWDFTWLPGGLLLALLLWFTLRLVSYRRRDVLLLLIPLYGIWLAAKVGARLAALPYRDWRPREDELSRLRQVEGSDRYYLLADATTSPSNPESAAEAGGNA